MIQGLMMKLSDEELLAELKRRFTEQKELLQSMNELTEKLKTVNQKLIESEQLKTDFLSNIRNEINNPLTAILGISENLSLEENIDMEVVKEMVKTIHMEAFNLDFQLRTIFAAAEIEAGEARLHISKVNMDEMMHRIVHEFRQIADSKSVHLELDIQLKSVEGNAIQFLTDPEKIHLVISNLLSNALEYGGEGEKIEIKSWIEGEIFYVAVRDYGIGISYNDQKKIFDRFVQLDTGITKKYRGHGLGLSVTRSAIEMLKGSISVRSGEGNGSIFSISVPQMKVDEAVESYAEDGNEELF